MKLTQKIQSTVRHVMLYGPPKAGKSKLAGSLAEKFNLLWFDLEKGHAVLFQLPQEWQERIELIEIPDTPSFPIAIQTMLKVIKGQRTRICHAHGVALCAACLKNKDKTDVDFTEVELNALGSDWVVVVDSGTQLTESAIRHITKGQDEDYKLKTDDWGNLGKLMSLFYGYIQNAPFHIVVISHETDLAKKDEDPTQIVPSAGSKNFARSVSRYFDDVVYCERKNGRHVAASSTLYNQMILTGSRSGISLEKNKGGEVSLLDLFDPTRVKTSAAAEASQDTVAQGNMTALERIKARMQAGK